MVDESGDKSIQKRQVAFKVSIFDIINGTYVKEEGWNPNYIKIGENKVSRVNMLGTVVLKNDESSVVIDDGSAKIPARVFENPLFFKDIDVGDVLLVVGRPREFGNEKYILPEIIKKIDSPLWIKLRSLENENFSKITTKIKGEDKKREEITQEIDEKIASPSENIFSLIKKLDKGQGVQIEDVIKNSGLENVENTINLLLERGEIFEVEPGKVRVLE